jgi:hypothetical protein
MTTQKSQDEIMMAFAPVCTPDGRFGLGAAERNQPGYWPVPAYGTFDTWEDASNRAQELNTKRGLEPETAALIVASSMAGKGTRRRA